MVVRLTAIRSTDSAPRSRLAANAARKVRRLIRRTRSSGERFAVEGEQTCPGSFGFGLVVDSRIRGAPAMHRLIDVDLRGQVRLFERLLHDVFLFRRLLVVILGDADQEL